jgi:hypothetical protein
VKQDGKVVVRKGERLLGRIVASEAEGEAEGKAASESRLAAQFDRLKSGTTTTELNTVVTAILSARGSAAGAPPMDNTPELMSPPSRPSGGGGGGLLGGAGATVGSTLGAAGSLTGGLGGAVDSTADASLGGVAGLGSGPALGTPLSAIRVESQSSASQSTGLQSVFSSDKGSLRLESGTSMQFKVVGQAGSQ